MHYGLNDSRVRNFQHRRHCNGARLALHTVHCGLNESRVRNFQQRRRCNGARLALHTVHCGLNESRVRNYRQRRHCNGARLALDTVHCDLKQSRVRNFQQRRQCNGALLVLHTVHCGLHQSRAHFQQRRQFNGALLVLHTVHCGLNQSGTHFQQRRQFNGARLVPYHRRHIMAEHDTNNIQAILKFRPRFDDKYKAQFFITRTGFASSCRSIGKASPPFSRAIRSRQSHKILPPWQCGRARTRTFPVSCSSPRSVLPTTLLAHGQDPGGCGR